DRNHDALGAEIAGGFRDHRGGEDGRRVERDLVGARAQRLLHVLVGAHAAADGERDEEPLRRPAGDLVHRLPRLERRGDVEEDDLVGAFELVALGERGGIPDVGKILELDALDDPSRLHVEARDDALGEHYFFQRTLPLVDWSSPAGRVAWRSAIPKALNVASLMWWKFFPRCTRLCSVIRASSARLRKKCSSISSGRSTWQNGRSTRSTLTVTSASSIGIVAVPTRWTGRPWSASRSTLPIVSATSSTMWWLKSPDAFTWRSNWPNRATDSSMCLSHLSGSSMEYFP